MNNQNQHRRISKLMSLVLRHNPGKIGIELDENGWANTTDLLDGINKKGIRLDMELLETVVETNDKKRFSFNEDQSKIRANQGHSIKIDMQFEAIEPPAFLYHGTVGRFMKTIQTEGLKKMNRQHVHLSKDLETAQRVGSRRGVPVILTVRSGEMHQDGFEFYQSDNGVWLTDRVPAKYLDR